jgi:hypothetical protein
MVVRGAGARLWSMRVLAIIPVITLFAAILSVICFFRGPGWTISEAQCERVPARLTDSLIPAVHGVAEVVGRGLLDP